MRRLVAVLAAFLLLGALGASPVLADGGSCVTNVSTGIWTISGQTVSSSLWSASGAQVAIAKRDPAITGFHICGEHFGDSEHNGPLMYVTLFPRNAIGPCSAVSVGTQCFIRYGISECYPPPNGTCNAGATRQVFIETAGCQGSTVNRYNKGAAADETTSLSFYLDTDLRFHFFQDGVGAGSISRDDSYVGCWTHGTNMVGYFFGRYDEGDSIATNLAAAATEFVDVRYGRYGLGWSSPGWGAGTCAWVDAPDEHCVLVGGQGGDDLYEWTTD